MISYNVYWIVVITGFLVLRFREAKGHLPLARGGKPATQSLDANGPDLMEPGVGLDEKTSPVNTEGEVCRVSS